MIKAKSHAPYFIAFAAKFSSFDVGSLNSMVCHPIFPLDVIVTFIGDNIHLCFFLLRGSFFYASQGKIFT
jgi:hypothetical protein